MRRAASIARQMRVSASVQNTLPTENFALQGVAEEGFLAPFGVRHASRQILQQRMKSVKNISKITAAMKMVAASRLRGAQAKAEAAQGIWQPMTKLLGDTPGVDVPNNLTVCVSSDRGLCGGVNTNAAKQFRAINSVVSSLGEGEKEFKFAIIGDKGNALLKKELGDGLKTLVVDATKSGVTFSGASLIADELLKIDTDATRVVFNKFKSAISFIPTMSTTLSAEVLEKRAEAEGFMNEYEIEEEDRAPLLTDLAEFQLATNLYVGMLENYASELGSRMSAMDSSTKNAGEMLDKLTLTYNRSRQAAITTELIEIISGAAALEG
ncbi:hypothetical protein CYMTET_43199 [Cymbomonas tetramitiformis]|uniref:ATP synthase subunit gamma n=1 Tax=Cymbomonas tetramitiformis TaxID=36881 RepID=A0AAE0BH00_9CHLO|nr:hypothetical protein CYMTET_53457 [Cymbomonas tetramitiformis]KAK3247297.1 hypothetical protein CYMTET_43199 [Cymbomonas tetramitiformis]|eukprot:gene23939-29047_t